MILKQNQTPGLSLHCAKPRRTARGLFYGANSGYTIVEVMIFLAVSAALLFSVMLLIAGQQRRAEFTQALGDLQSGINDVMNDVATGHYIDTNNFTCKAPAPLAAGYPDTTFDAGKKDFVTPSVRPITSSSGGGTQGTNDTCIFIGQAIQFNPQNTKAGNFVRLYSVAGRRLDPSAVGGIEKNVDNLHRAIPTPIHYGKLINNGKGGIPFGSEDFVLSPALYFRRITYEDAGGTKDLCGFGFFTTLNQANPADGLVSGSTATDLIPFLSGSRYCGLHQDISKNLDQQSFVDLVHDSMVEDAPGGTPYTPNPPKGITLCVTDNGNSQYALVTIGGANSGGFKVERHDGDGTVLDVTHCKPVDDMVADAP